MGNSKRIKEINQRLSETNISEKEASVREIINDVVKKGDLALQHYSKKFDGVELSSFKQDFSNALDLISDELKHALKNAAQRIEKFHLEEMKSSNLKSGWSFTGDLNEKLGVKYLALDSTAIYVPGGQAPLVSTVLMTAIPAKVAGVKRIVMFSPPPINTAILAAAKIAGVDEVYSIGGAQAIAAAAYGTETIKPVDKIVGPGNVYVSLAKKMVFGKVGIDGVFGPSELAIVADDSADSEYLAADLISQLEHGSGLESALMLTSSAELAQKTREEFYKQVDAMKALKTEQQIKTILNSFEKWSDILVVANLDEAAELINLYAPEHLELQLEPTVIDSFLSNIRHAGAVFIGAKSCESLGDYLAGPSHCLPTNTSARFSSGLQSSDFIKKISIIDFSSSKDAEFQQIIKDVAIIARVEELEGHARAMEKRYN